MSYLKPCLASAALFIVAVFFVSPTEGQVSTRAVPYSFHTAVDTDVATVALPAPRLDAPEDETFTFDKNGFHVVKPDRHGIEVPVDLGLDHAGRWEMLPGGGRLWRVRIVSRGATSLNLIYDDFWMPPGARLFLYTDDRSVVRGAFTQQNNKAYGGFATDVLPGEATILEYYEPAGAEPGRLHVSTVVHGLNGQAGTDPLTTSGTYTPTSLSCSMNTACPEGSGWEDEASAVVKIVQGGSSCTGVLLNNTREDGKPYVLTANHCGNPSVGQEVNWVFQFNYESATCADPSQDPSHDSVTGGIVRAAAGGNGDFTLLELSEPVPSSFHATFAGWSMDGVAPANGTVIGHPKGDIKKITIDNDPVLSFGSDFWQATFDHGTIENNSSGSPLFNENHQFVGHVKAARQLDHNMCSGPGGDDNVATIIFPKLSYIWDLGSPGERLSDFLDPDGTGATNVSSRTGSGTDSGGDTPASIWVNEINADTRSGGASEDDEFVEIVGQQGSSLGGYQLDVYTCANQQATLQSTQVVNATTLTGEYGEYGVYVLGGLGLSSSERDQVFSGSGQDVLPDGSGVLVLKDGSGQEVFDYQYDDPNTPSCPSNRTTRSAGDASGDATMGFVVNNPSGTDQGTAFLTATPGQENWDGGQQLPVELVAFDALVDGRDVLLRWETASETNNAGFEVQTRNSKLETRKWEVLGFVEGHGTTEAAQSYAYQVQRLAPGVHRFRLKQVDYDGTFAYSPEVEVAVGIDSPHQVSKAYPNPFNPQTQFSLSVARSQRVEVAVYDLMGRRVAHLYEGRMDEQSSRSFVFEGHNLPSGVYLVRVLGEYFADSQTVTLLK